MRRGSVINWSKVGDLACWLVLALATAIALSALIGAAMWMVG